jgi:hypothetical protein
MRGWLGAAVVGWVAGLLPLAGCGEAPRPQPAETRLVPPISAEVREKLLDGAMNVLGHLETYDESSAFAQVFDRLNQWSHADPVRDETATSSWNVDPLFESLPQRLREGVSSRGLASPVFDAATDLVALRDRRWLADVARTAAGDALDDIEIATSLFAWTVRSLAITTDPPPTPTAATPGSRWFLPGELLLAGRASAAQRAWVFLELLHQAGLEGVMLATGTDADGRPRPWVPAVISGGEAYLFEPAYGLPIPGPGGVGVATARQAAADPTVLRQMDVADRKYPVAAADMAALQVLVNADALSLSRRMRLLQDRLVGAAAVRLAVDASAVAARAAAAVPSTDAPPVQALWAFPWEVMTQRKQAGAVVAQAASRELAVMSVAFQEESRPGSGRAARMTRPLYAARLREFRGDIEGPDGAKVSYLAARPSTATIIAASGQAPPQQQEAVRRLYEQMKEDATYWLGVLTLGEGDYPTAVDYLGRMTLDAAPDGRWAAAARLNLAEAELALGRQERAAELLRADTSPQRFGSRMRLKQIGEEPAASDPIAGSAAAE